MITALFRKLGLITASDFQAVANRYNQSLKEFSEQTQQWQLRAMHAMNQRTQAWQLIQELGLAFEKAVIEIHFIRCKGDFAPCENNECIEAKAKLRRLIEEFQEVTHAAIAKEVENANKAP